MEKADMIITSKEVPRHNLFDVVQIHYFSKDGVLTEVPAQIIGGTHPNYILKFTIGKKVMRACTVEG